MYPRLLIHPILTCSFSLLHFGYTIILFSKEREKVISDTGLGKKHDERIPIYLILILLFPPENRSYYGRRAVMQKISVSM